MSRLNPVVEESLLHRFFSRPAAVLLSIHLLLLSTLLLASWPGGNTARAILYGDSPQTFQLIVVFSFLSLAFTVCILDAPPFSGRESVGEWLRLGPIGLCAYFRGKLLSLLLQTILHWALTVPFLVLSGSVAGHSSLEIFTAAGAILFFTFTYRIVGFSAALLLEGKTVSLYALLLGFLAFFVFAGGAVDPASNPIIVLSGLVSEDSLLMRNLSLAGTPAGRLLRSTILHAVILAVFFLLAVLRGRGVRKGEMSYSRRDGKPTG